jgi:drug/metabolite transporter (DMT)-like permease
VRFSRIDALLLVMTLIWGTNYSIVKHAFRELDPQAFNAARMTIASAVFFCLLVGVRRSGTRAGILFTPATITRRDWLSLRSGSVSCTGPGRLCRWPASMRSSAQAPAWEASI